MKQRLFGLMMVLCLVLCLIPMQAFATNEEEVIKLDVAMANTENEDYKVMDDAINIRKSDVVYELSGTTSRKIQMWGSNDLDNIKTFYLRLNKAEITGGITFWNGSGARLVIEVVDGTENTISRVYSVNLTITGSGTLNSGDLGVTQCKDTRNPSTLYIKDTTIKVNNHGNASQWNGTCVLDGNANVTYNNTADSPALNLGQTSQFTHSLTMKGNSKLYCLHSNAAEPSAYSVSGFQGSSVEFIQLQDNAYFEAQGRDGSGEYLGYGILTPGDIKIQDNATIKVTSYGEALCINGDLIATGGKIITKSENGAGIFSYNGGKINISNAEVEAEGSTPALYGDGGVILENCKVKANSADSCGIYSPNDIKIKDSFVKVSAVEDSDGIYAKGATTISGSWIETSGGEQFAVAGDRIENSVLFNKNKGKVIGNAVIPFDETVANELELDIPEGTTLTVPEGKTLTNDGKISVIGTIVREGTIICNSHSGGEATCTEQAKCAVCEQKYGDLDSGNHTGEKIWITTETTHKQKWDCCDLETVAEEKHNWENGKCKDCNLECAHSGGKADCAEKAVCEICGQKYGELAPNNHADLKHFPAKAATKTAEGNIEYWYCDGCKKYFSDKDATKEISKAETVTEKLKDDGSSDSPKTEDNSHMSLWIALLCVSGGALAGTLAVSKKKKFGR